MWLLGRPSLNINVLILFIPVLRRRTNINKYETIVESGREDETVGTYDEVFCEEGIVSVFSVDSNGEFKTGDDVTILRIADSISANASFVIEYVGDTAEAEPTTVDARL